MVLTWEGAWQGGRNRELQHWTVLALAEPLKPSGGAWHHQERARGQELDASSVFGGAVLCVAAPHHHLSNLYYISTDKTATWHCIADVCNFCQDVEQRPGTWVETGARRSSGVAALC